MHELAISFSNFCKHTFNLNDTITYSYNSLPICVIDCVYSLRAKYNSVTVPIVQRYADKYLNGDTTNSNDTISAFIMHLEELDNISNFADILKNHQVSGGIPKEKIAEKGYFTYNVHIKRKFVNSVVLAIKYSYVCNIRVGEYAPGQRQLSIIVQISDILSVIYCIVSAKKLRK